MKKILALLLFANVFYAQTLDTSFDGDGKMFKQFSNSGSNQQVFDGFVQPDGKVVVCGGFVSPFLNAYVARFNADGSKDLSFNQTGFQNVLGGLAKTICRLSDGKYLVGASDFITKLNADGTIDTSFAQGCRFLLLYLDNKFVEIHKISVQDDNKIIISGYASNGTDRNFIVVRLNSDGTLDTSFNFSGYNIIPIGAENVAYSHQIQNDGKIVVVGDANYNSRTQFCVVRLTVNGVLDTSFGMGGIVLTSMSNVSPTVDRARNLIVLPSGKILVLGTSDDSLTLVMYNANGTLDTTYNSTGINVTADYISYVSSNVDENLFPKMMLDATGKILLGYSSSANFTVTRLLSDAITLDSSFSGGRISESYNFDKFSILGVKPNGKIIMGGYSSTFSNVNSSGVSLIKLYELNTNGTVYSNNTKELFSGYDYLDATAVSPIDGSVFMFTRSMMDGKPVYKLIKMSKEGNLDASFATNGIYNSTLPSVGTQSEIFTLQDGGVLLRTSGNIYKFTAQGILDATFGNNGRLNLYASDAKIRKIINAKLTHDNKIVMSVYYANSQKTFDNAVIKFDLNGIKDTSFGTNGVAVFRFNSDQVNFNEELNCIDVDSQGKIVGVSVTRFKSGGVYTEHRNLNVVRLNSNGEMDLTFGNGGKMVHSSLSMVVYPKRVLRNNDGKILIDFYEVDNNIARSKTMKLTTNGSMDTTYDFDGIANDCEENTSPFTSSALQNDGKLIKVSLVDKNKYLISRYLDNGTLDTTFGTNGKYFETVGVECILDDATILADGKLLVSGSSFDGDLQSVLLMKYTDLTLGAIDFVIAEKSMMVYPNPIADQAVFEYTLNTSENIGVSLVDITGKTIKVIENNTFKSPNTYKIDLNLEGLQAGMYFVKINAENKGTQTLKVIKK